MPRTTLFVGRLPYDTRTRDLEDAFYKYHPITIEVKRGGYAFVTFEHSRDAEAARDNLDGIEILGHRVSIEWARGGKKSRENEGCFRCGRHGHWARNCPNGGSGSGSGRSTRRRRSRSRSRSRGRSSRHSRRSRSRSRSRSKSRSRSPSRSRSRGRGRSRSRSPSRSRSRGGSRSRSRSRSRSASPKRSLSNQTANGGNGAGPGAPISDPQATQAPNSVSENDSSLNSQSSAPVSSV